MVLTWVQFRGIIPFGGSNTRTYNRTGTAQRDPSAKFGCLIEMECDTAHLVRVQEGGNVEQIVISRLLNAKW